ncbi:MAG: hypothetical protein ACLU8D_14335 [Enterocloster sp.]
MINQETSKEQVCIWIIRFADYTLASFLGTYQQAVEKAEEKKTFTAAAIQSHKKTRTRQCTGKGLRPSENNS